MRYWKYKAYDASGKISDGIVSGDSVDEIILELRQNGWQVFDLVTIQEPEFKHQSSIRQKLNNLDRLTKKLTKPTQFKKAKPKVSIPIWIWFVFIVVLVIILSRFIVIE